MSQKKLIIFAGPSGTGKTTIVKHLLSAIPSLSFSVSATIRARRGVEVDGVDYHFLTEQDFRKKISENSFAEYEEVYEGLFYGTLHSEIEKKWSDSRDVIFDIDVVGALNLKKQFGERALAVIVMPPSIEVLRDRLIKRGTETEESLIKRVGKAERELASANLFDERIVNDCLDESFVTAEKLVSEFIESK